MGLGAIIAGLGGGASEVGRQKEQAMLQEEERRRMEEDREFRERLAREDREHSRGLSEAQIAAQREMAEMAQSGQTDRTNLGMDRDYALSVADINARGGTARLKPPTYNLSGDPTQGEQVEMTSERPFNPISVIEPIPQRPISMGGAIGGGVDPKLFEDIRSNVMGEFEQRVANRIEADPTLISPDKYAQMIQEEARAAVEMGAGAYSGTGIQQMLLNSLVESAVGQGGGGEGGGMVDPDAEREEFRQWLDAQMRGGVR